MQALPNRICPLCGGANQCAPAESGRLDLACWCTRVAIPAEVLQRIPADQLNRACLCPRCAGLRDAVPPSADTMT